MSIFMKVTIVGKKEISFDTDKGHVEGLKLYCNFEPDDKRNFEGLMADSIFISSNSPFGIPDQLKIGDEIELIYSRSGLSADSKDKLVSILDKAGKPVHCKKFDSANAPRYF